MGRSMKTSLNPGVSSLFEWHANGNVFQQVACQTGEQNWVGIWEGLGQILFAN